MLISTKTTLSFARTDLLALQLNLGGLCGSLAQGNRSHYGCYYGFLMWGRLSLWLLLDAVRGPNVLKSYT